MTNGTHVKETVGLATYVKAIRIFCMVQGSLEKTRRLGKLEGSGKRGRRNKDGLTQ